MISEMTGDQSRTLKVGDRVPNKKTRTAVAIQTTTLKNVFMSKAPNCSRRVFLDPLKPPVA